jgi:hypothetical protein
MTHKKKSQKLAFHLTDGGPSNKKSNINTNTNINIYHETYLSVISTGLKDNRI